MSIDIPGACALCGADLASCYEAACGYCCAGCREVAGFHHQPLAAQDKP